MGDGAAVPSGGYNHDVLILNKFMDDRHLGGFIVSNLIRMPISQGGNAG